MSAPLARLGLAVLNAVALACGSSEAATANPPGQRLASAALRITTPAPTGDLQAAVASNTQFGLDLMRALVAAAPQQNLAFSPYSVSVALAMTYGGAAGTTHAAFDQTLHQGLAEPAYHRAMNDLDRQLAARGQGAAGTDGQPFRLDVTNQLFADLKATFRPTWLDLLAQEYGAAVQLLDFAGAPDPSRVSINGWVARKTSGHIQDLLPPGIINRDTRGVLVNAIYFNAAWAKKFDPGQTAAAPFRQLDGTPTTVPTMHARELAARAATVDGVEVVSLAYDGRELSMLILMPTTQGLPAFEGALTAAGLDRYVAALQPATLTLALPRFTIRTNAPLTATLSSLGLADAFTDRADFSRMATEPMKLTDVVHQAVVIVDEAGTVAAAATGVVVGPTAMPVTRTVTIDRPFVYLVRDEATGAIVFLGRCVNPGA